MPPQQIVVQSNPKWQFLMSLQLDGRKREDQALYWMMKSEAIRVYDAQLMGNRGALKPQYARENPPFSANQFSETAFVNAINTIVRNASPQTCDLYQQGATTTPNWVARWILYHVCRYRDGRNKKAARSKNFHDDDDDKIAEGRPPPPPPPPPSAGPTVSNGKGKGHTAVYDPARNEYR